VSDNKNFPVGLLSGSCPIVTFAPTPTEPVAERVQALTPESPVERVEEVIDIVRRGIYPELPGHRPSVTQMIGALKRLRTWAIIRLPQLDTKNWERYEAWLQSFWPGERPPEEAQKYGRAVIRTCELLLASLRYVQPFRGVTTTVASADARDDLQALANEPLLYCTLMCERQARTELEDNREHRVTAEKTYAWLQSDCGKEFIRCCREESSNATTRKHFATFKIPSLDRWRKNVKRAREMMNCPDDREVDAEVQDQLSHVIAKARLADDHRRIMKPGEHEED
jgi:hypothetical protein